MKNIRFSLSENFHFSVIQFSVHLNRCGFVMHIFLSNTLTCLCEMNSTMARPFFNETVLPF